MGLTFPPQGRLFTDSHPHNCYGVNTMDDKATLFKQALLPPMVSDGAKMPVQSKIEARRLHWLTIILDQEIATLYPEENSDD